MTFPKFKNQRKSTFYLQINFPKIGRISKLMKSSLRKLLYEEYKYSERIN